MCEFMCEDDFVNSFVALDFETANDDQRSVTQIGAVAVEDGQIVDRFEKLVLPEEEYRYFGHEAYDDSGNFRRVYDDALEHGENWNDVIHEFMKFAKDLDLVAHNASFDQKCLNEINSHFNIDYFPKFHDTVKIAKDLLPEARGRGNGTLRNLAVNIFELTSENEYLESGHTAYYDAELCALIYLKLAEVAKKI